MSDDDSSQSFQVFAGLARRTLARAIDFVVLSLLALIVGLGASLILAVFRAEDFQAYLNWTIREGGSTLNFRDLAARDSDNLFNCRAEENFEECKKAESFSMSQTVLIIGIFVSLQCLYFGLLTSSKFQATLGKYLLRLKVVDNSFKRPNWWQGLTREILFVFVFLTSGLSLYWPQIQFVGVVLEFVLLAGFVKIVFSHDKTALHDNLAYTKVVLNK